MMKLDQNGKHLIATLVLVDAIIVAVNAVVAPETARDMLPWSVGLLAVAILFWIWIRRDAKTDQSAHAAKAAEAAANEAEALAKRREVRRDDGASAPLVPAAEQDATADESDDLTVLWGIGADYQRILYEAEIRTYSRLASLSEAELEAVFPGRLPSHYQSLPKQAELAAKGDWDGLSAFQERL